jgi:hypothetical protein
MPTCYCQMCCETNEAETFTEHELLVARLSREPAPPGLLTGYDDEGEFIKAYVNKDHSVIVLQHGELVFEKAYPFSWPQFQHLYCVAEYTVVSEEKIEEAAAASAPQANPPNQH